MEQLSFDDINDIKINYENIQDALSAVEIDNALQTGRFIIKDNKSKETVVGYSILLDTSLAAKINLKKCSFSTNIAFFKDYIVSGFTKYKELSNPQNFIEFEFESTEHFWKSFKNVLNAFVAEYATSERFGCCHRYVECSDAGKCIAPDPIHAKGCYYKENLEKGKIFYGKNATV